MIRKLGRNPRTFNPKIPHMSSLMPTLKLPELPASVDWSKGISNWGMMKNDLLGCCTCAGVYHMHQIQTLNTLTEQTESDNCVLDLYEKACGYQPGNPNTDNGGIEQNVLEYLLNTGFLLNNGTRDKIIAFIEVDPRNIIDIKHTINEFGGCYIGFMVPSNLFDPETGEPPKVWQFDPAHTETEGGHCVFICGYSSVGPIFISWGSIYQMSWDFFEHYTEESYGILSKDWLNSTGKTPLNMTIEQLEQLMSAIKE